MIKSLEFTDSNFETAWKLLRERYDNKRILVNNHVNALFNLEHLKHESCQKLREFIDVVSKHLYALRQLGLPTDKWDILLIHMITTKLDSATLRAWEKCQYKDQFPTYEKLKHFLKSRADLLEALDYKVTGQDDKINKRVDQRFDFQDKSR